MGLAWRPKEWRGDVVAPPSLLGLVPACYGYASRGYAGIKESEINVAKTSAQYATKAQAGVKQERKKTIVEAELARIYAKYGRVDAEILLNEATPKASPIHQYFEWDDSEAAHRYRLQQATAMIIASKFVVFLNEREKSSLPDAVAARPVEVRNLVSAFRGEGFVMRNKALSQDDLRQAIIAKKLQVLRHWCDEACDIPELRRIRRGILKLLPPK